MQQSGDVDFQATSNSEILKLYFHDGRKGGCQSRFMKIKMLFFTIHGRVSKNKDREDSVSEMKVKSHLGL